MLGQKEDQSLKDASNVIVQAISLTDYRGKGRSGKPIRKTKRIRRAPSLESPVAFAIEFYLKEKFSGNLIAQILAKRNIEQDQEFGTLDETGRFQNFRLAENGQNAQLQCWELFPHTVDQSNSQRFLLHRQGYGLMLKSLSFIEDDPESHTGLRSIEVSDPIDGLTETERNRLNALILISLNDRLAELRQWERTHYFDALRSLSRLFGC